MRELKIIKVRSWDELPDILEPGVYNIEGETHIIEEEVPKKVILRALKYKRAGKTLI